MSTFSALLETVWRGPAVQKIYGRIPDDHVLDAGYVSRDFERDQGYFTISLSEMFLANARKLWQGLAPLTVAAAEFDYGGHRQSVPFVVGKDLLASTQAYLKDQNVEYRNTRIFGPCPYTGGNISLFVGLFEAPSNSPATEFFSVLGDIVGAFDLTGLSGYLPVAKVVTAGLGRLLGLSGTNLRIGARDEFIGETDANNKFREGFLAYVNCSPEQLGGALWAKDGALLSGRTRDSAQPVTGYDHCLIRVDWRAERNDYTSLPFHASWKRAQGFIWQNQTDKARASFLELVQQVAESPDLTARHRLALLSAYRGNFEAELELYRATTGGVLRPSGKRDSASGPANPKATIQTEALTARNAGFGKEVENTLLELARSFPHFNEVRASNPILTDAVLAEQMRMIGTSTADPRQLADALMIAAFRSSGMVGKREPEASGKARSVAGSG